MLQLQQIGSVGERKNDAGTQITPFRTEHYENRGNKILAASGVFEAGHDTHSTTSSHALAGSAPKEPCGGQSAFERWFELHGKAQSTHELQTVNFPLTDALKLALGQARWEGLSEEEKKVTVHCLLSLLEQNLLEQSSP